MLGGTDCGSGAPSVGVPPLGGFVDARGGRAGEEGGGRRVCAHVRQPFRSPPFLFYFSGTLVFIPLSRSSMRRLEVFAWHPSQEWRPSVDGDLARLWESVLGQRLDALGVLGAVRGAPVITPGPLQGRRRAAWSGPLQGPGRVSGGTSGEVLDCASEVRTGTYGRPC